MKDGSFIFRFKILKQLVYVIVQIFTFTHLEKKI